MTAQGCSPGPQLQPLAADAVILAFGDSLTAGTGAGASESYPVLLEKLSGRRVVNAGVPGEVSSVGVQRIAAVLDREKPALVIICHGGNDLLQKLDQKVLEENLREMIRIAREKNVQVLLLAVPFPELSLAPPGFYAEIARESALPIDVKSLAKILGKRSLKSDYIHPNAAGYRILAENIMKLLRNTAALP